jgi:predicted metal-dependent peptidase
MIKGIEARLRAARTRMLFKGNWSWFGYLSMHLKMQPVQGLGTVATNGEEFLYDPVTVDSESVEFMEFDWAHEIMHLVGMDLTRAPKQDVMVTLSPGGPPFPLWNIACDLWINLKLEEESFTVPPFVPIDRKYKGWSKDQIYHDLRKRVKENGGTCEGLEGISGKRPCGGLKKKKKGKGKGKGGSGGGKDKKKKKGTPELEKWRPSKEDIEKWKQRAREALEAAKARGTAPGFAQTIVEKLLESKQDWRAVLWQFCTRSAKEWRFTPPSRTGAARGIILPRLVPDDEIDHGVLCVDSSGSISDENLTEFLTEMEAICTMARMTVTVIVCDAVVRDVYRFEPGEFNWKAIGFTGRGGTDFIPAFDKIEELNISPTFMIYFTDTWGSFPDQEPEYPVLWASSEPDGKVPWGQYISLREETL